MSARKADRLEVVPWCLPDGDNTYVQIATGEEGENKTKPKVGTLYSLIKPLEKAAAQKGTQVTLTSYGKVEAKGQAGMDLASNIQRETLSILFRTAS